MLFRFIFALALLSTNHTKLFANDFENGIRAFEEKKDEEAFEYFKRSYFENPFNKITCAYLQNIQKILKFNPNQHGLPDNLLEDSFYDSFDFLGKYIDTSFIKPALTYRKMQEIEEQLLTSINLPIQKSNKIKKLNTTKAHLQKEMIDLCNNQSRQALKLLIKDFKKNRDTYSTKRARNTQDLQKFFLELSKKYCVAINLDNLLFIYGQDLNVLLNEGIENILNILYYFLFSVGDLEAFEHFATMDATHITSLFKYIELNKPNSKKSNIILRILAQFYNSIKDNEDKNYLLSIVAQRHKELVKKTKKDPFETYFLLDNLIFKYLAAIGNTQVIESLTKNFFLEGTQKRKMALYFSKLGELQNNYTCSLILAKILEERNNVHDIKMSKEIYMKLLKNSSDDEQKICLISLIIEIFRNYGISDLKSPLITESYREECNWLHKNAEELNHPDLPHILLILSLIGNAYALQNEDMTHQKENYERAIASYAIDSNLSALITICQMLIADNGSALTNSKTKINYYEQFIENTSKFDPVLRENSSEILEFVYPKLGFCYYHESQYNCAAYYFKKSIEGADFYSIPAYVNICIVYLKNYNKEELKKLLEKALSLRSEDGICFFFIRIT
jgi:hypothetical protein